MKIQSFVKRLNATELGLGATHDAFIAIPSEIDLSVMFENQKVIYPFNQYSGGVYNSTNSKLKYVQTGQNNQERISGLGEFYAETDAKVGDEFIIEKIEDSSMSIKYYIDLYHRNVIVFQVNKIEGMLCVDILPNDIIGKYAVGLDYKFDITLDGQLHSLSVKFLKEAKKKKTSPEMTKFYDLLLDSRSIVSNYRYQEYIELVTEGMRLGKMRTYWYSELEVMEDNING